jgi:serine/threonine-protein kinase
LFLTSDGIWKILDFGVASLGESSGTLTAGGIVGTPTYMAPEQARGEQVDHRADLYAIAAIIYRCVTGRRMFSGTDTPSLLYKVVHRMPPRPSGLATLPEDADRFLAIGLAKRKQDRFETGAQMREALEQAMCNGLSAKQRKHADSLMRKYEWDDRA